MPLPERAIAIRCAVVCFFVVCVIGVAMDLDCGTCSQRGAWAAFFTYIGARLALKAINAILMQAIVTNWMDQSKDQAGDE